MNCVRSGSPYGSLQSIRLIRYGDTRTLMGAREKPSVASAMNASDDEPLQRLEQLVRAGDRLLRLPVVIEELLVGHLFVGGDTAEVGALDLVRLMTLVAMIGPSAGRFRRLVSRS
jgi:hypothetical protein